MSAPPDDVCALSDSIVATTPAQRRRAALTVAANAHDPADCAQLLAALGLIICGQES